MPNSGAKRLIMFKVKWAPVDCVPRGAMIYGLSLVGSGHICLCLTFCLTIR